MNDLIKVDYSGGKPAVSARELHEFLEVGADYRHWFPRMCEYGFSEGEDFRTFLTESTGGRRGQDAAITIDMAKEICMLQRNEKGKIARRYFLQLERDWNSPEKVMARALQIADQKIKSLEDTNAYLEAENAQLVPKALFADAVAASDTDILVGELAKLLRQNGVEIGEKRLFQRLRDDGYLIRRKGTDYNMPTQRAVEMGLFRIKETAITHSKGNVTISKTPKVTGKGQRYFLERYL